MKAQRVTDVQHLQEYRLRIQFSDGLSFELDFWPMLEGRADPLHGPLHDVNEFRKVGLNGLTIEWTTGLDVCPDGLREWCEAGKVVNEDFASAHTPSAIHNP